MSSADRRGKLIVLSGIDGSGKTTQIKLIANRLIQAGQTVRSIKYPQYEDSFFGRVVRDYLDGRFGDASEIDPYLAAIPYAADRWESLPKLRRWLAEDAWVLCDRYVSANMAHQGGKIRDPRKRANFYRWVKRMEHEVFALPVPDLEILLWIPPEMACNYVVERARREGRTLDGHERNIRHALDTAEAYREIAEASENWTIIECAPSGRRLAADEVCELIWTEIRRRFPACLR